VREQPGILPEQSDAPLPRRHRHPRGAGRGQRPPAQLDAGRTRLDQAGDDLEDGRLARPPTGRTARPAPRRPTSKAARTVKVASGQPRRLSTFSTRRSRRRRPAAAAARPPAGPGRTGARFVEAVSCRVVKICNGMAERVVGDDHHGAEGADLARAQANRPATSPAPVRPAGKRDPPEHGERPVAEQPRLLLEAGVSNATEGGPESAEHVVRRPTRRPPRSHQARGRCWWPIGGTSRESSRSRCTGRP